MMTTTVSTTTTTTITVPGHGRLPNTVLVCGEAPGREEARERKPFVGKSGQEQERYLNRIGLSSGSWYKTNVVKEYIEGNPDPTPEQVKRWTPHLLEEVYTCNPDLIITVGRFAAQFFLGESATMETVHGLPHRPGALDSSRRNRAPSHTVILPCYHPAAGFRDQDLQSFIAWDYWRAGETLKKIRRGEEINFREDLLSGDEAYLDISGRALSRIVQKSSSLYPSVAIDTESTEQGPWSIQACFDPGTSYVLRVSRPDFREGISALQSLTVSNPSYPILMHNAMYDISICRAMGLNLRRARVLDTMYMSYLLRLEPQGLKPLAYRWAGMSMTDFSETIGVMDVEPQLKYLRKVASLTRSWPKPDTQTIVENDGTIKLYNPQPIHRRAEGIIKDIESGKINKDGEPTNPAKRWKDVDRILRTRIEDLLGRIPVASIATLYERDPDKAIYYSCRDADATRRVFDLLVPELDSMRLTDLFYSRMKNIHAIEEMMHEGLPASRAHFVDLKKDMLTEMRVIRKRLSKGYFDGKPFNPNSTIQVGRLLDILGLESTKVTKTGLQSTSKKAIQHLALVSPAIRDVFDWRERSHIVTSFCNPALELIPEER